MMIVIWHALRTAFYMGLLALAGFVLGSSCDSLSQVPWLAGVVGTVLMPVATSFPDLIVCYASLGNESTVEDLEVGFAATVGSVALGYTVSTALTLLVAIASYKRRRLAELQEQAASNPNSPRLKDGPDDSTLAVESSPLKEVHPALGLLRIYSDIFVCFWLQLLYLVPAVCILHFVDGEREKRLFLRWQITCAALYCVAFLLYVLDQARRSNNGTSLSPPPSAPASPPGELDPLFVESAADCRAVPFIASLGPFQLLRLTVNEKLEKAKEAAPAAEAEAPVPRLPPQLRGLPEQLRPSLSSSQQLAPAASYGVPLFGEVCPSSQRDLESAGTARNLSSFRSLRSSHEDAALSSALSRSKTPRRLCTAPMPMSVGVAKKWGMTKVQRLHLLWGSVCLAVGAVIALYAGDPMLESARVVADACGLPPFAIPFVVAALATNAPDVIVAMSCAGGAMPGGLSVALGSLLGGMVISYTLCMSLLLLMAYQANLRLWFPAETLTVILGHTAALFILGRKVLRRVHAFCLLFLYGLIMCGVVVMQRVFAT